MVEVQITELNSKTGPLKNKSPGRKSVAVAPRTADSGQMLFMMALQICTMPPPTGYVPILSPEQTPFR